MVIKYEYWHKIIAVNPKEVKDEKKYLGNLISNPHKKEGLWEFINFDNGEMTWKFDCKYVGRLPKGLQHEERMKQLKELQLK